MEAEKMVLQILCMSPAVEVVGPSPCFVRGSSVSSHVGGAWHHWYFMSSFFLISHWKQPVMPFFLPSSKQGQVCADSLKVIASAVTYRLLESNTLLLIPSVKQQPLGHSRDVLWGDEWTPFGCAWVPPKWHQALSGSFVAQRPLSLLHWLQHECEAVVTPHHPALWVVTQTHSWSSFPEHRCGILLPVICVLKLGFKGSVV